MTHAHTDTHTPINRMWSPLAYGLGGNNRLWSPLAYGLGGNNIPIQTFSESFTSWLVAMEPPGLL